jgi:hypothetical protein
LIFFIKGDIMGFTKKQAMSLAIVIITTSFFTFCGKNKSNVDFKVNSPIGQTLDPNVKVTFSQIKAQVLTPHCLSCHGDVATESGLKKWISPGKPDSSPFYTSVKNASMPKNQRPLDTGSLELIGLYIEQMAPTPPPASSGATGSTSGAGITFAQIKTSVLIPYKCLNCHSVGTEAQLARWMNKSNPAQSSFYTTMKNGSMPKGGPRASTQIQALVLQYIKDFAGR